ELLARSVPPTITISASLFVPVRVNTAGPALASLPFPVIRPANVPSADCDTDKPPPICRLIVPTLPERLPIEPAEAFRVPVEIDTGALVVPPATLSAPPLKLIEPAMMVPPRLRLTVPGVQI